MGRADIDRLGPPSMMGQSHLLLAAAAYAALAARPLETPLGTLAAPVLGGARIPEGNEALALSFAVAAACGLAPDLDKVGSTASRSLGIVSRALSWGVERSLGHRGGLHSLLGVALGLFVGDALGGLLGVTGLGALVAFGWAAHLLTDAWTVRGVPLLWPLWTGRVALPPWLTTGSRTEAVVLILALAGLFLYATGGPLSRAVGLT